jgi:hypothetical protein
MNMAKMFIKYWVLVIISIFLIFESCKSQSKDFEGIIYYSVKYAPHTSLLTEKDLINESGDTSIIYIKYGKFKQVYPNSKRIIQTLYDYESNRYYILIAGVDTVYYRDSNITNLDYSFSNILNSDTIIQGYPCKGARLSSQVDTSVYYYASSLPLSPKPFKNFSGYNTLINNTKSVYLSQIYKCKLYTAVGNAFRIEKMQLEDSLFRYPKYPLKKF